MDYPQKKGLARIYRGGAWLLGVIALCGATTSAHASTVDMSTVYNTWLGWNNDLRADMSLSGYTLDTGLQATALERSQTALSRGEISHKRNPKKDSYYDYTKIERRFGARGIYFKNVQRATFSESIGYGSYSCKVDDCTQAVIAGIKSTWNFFYSEKNKKSQPHYKALIHSRFKVMGIGIVLDELHKKYYLTVHYATEVVKK